MTVLAYRRATADDRRFVIESWLSSFRTAHAAGLVSMDSWHDVMEPELERILARPGVDVWVAHNPDQAGTDADLYGWLAVERQDSQPALVHYCYVKKPYRRMKMATYLLRRAGLSPDDQFHYTCRTAVVGKLPIPRARWQPLRARFDRPKTDPRNADGQDQRRQETS